MMKSKAKKPVRKRTEDPEKRKIISRRYREKNSEKILAVQRARRASYSPEKREEINVAKRKWYRKNRARILAEMKVKAAHMTDEEIARKNNIMRAWAIKNPDKVKEYRNRSRPKQLASAAKRKRLKTIRDNAQKRKDAHKAQKQKNQDRFDAVDRPGVCAAGACKTKTAAYQRYCKEHEERDSVVAVPLPWQSPHYAA